jgi:hypothetical protein
VATVKATVQLPAAPVLLQEGVERGEKVRHGSGRRIAERRAGRRPEMCLLRGITGRAAAHFAIDSD